MFNILFLYHTSIYIYIIYPKEILIYKQQPIFLNSYKCLKIGKNTIRKQEKNRYVGYTKFLRYIGYLLVECAGQIIAIQVHNVLHRQVTSLCVFLGRTGLYCHVLLRGAFDPYRSKFFVYADSCASCTRKYNVYKIQIYIHRYSGHAAFSLTFAVYVLIFFFIYLKIVTGPRRTVEQSATAGTYIYSYPYLTHESPRYRQVGTVFFCRSDVCVCVCVYGHRLTIAYS